MSGQNTIDEAVAITAAIAKGEAVQFRFVKSNGPWRDRVEGCVLPDFLNYQYRIKPSTTWIVVFERGHGPMVGSVHCEHLAAAINIASYSNTGGRKLLYVVKVEDDVATIQKTPS